MNGNIPIQNRKYKNIVTVIVRTRIPRDEFEAMQSNLELSIQIKSTCLLK